MGYRLEVSEAKHTICGGELYGYVDDKDLKKLKSYKWLKKEGYVERGEDWDYGFNPQIILSAEAFREFFDLYLEDYNKIYGCKVTLDDSELDSYNNDEDKILEWY